VNVQDTVSVFLLFFSRLSAWDCGGNKSVETNRYAEQFINSRGRFFTFRSSVIQWRPVMENEIYAVLCLFLLMGIIQKPTLWTYFSRRIRSPPGFGDVILRDRLELIMTFFTFFRKHQQSKLRRPCKTLENIAYHTWTTNFRIYTFPGRTFQWTNPLHYGRDCL
jgi:hypothetical protein